MLNGILVIDKDPGMTSGDVVYHLRKALHIRKMGHAGTLDPEVTGVLPIAIGQATKLIEMLHTKPKSYVGEGLFGYATDSYDATGTKIAEKKITEPFTREEIQTQMNKFLGKIEQVPPIYSAVKVNGKRLYEYAREGIEVDRPKRLVEIERYDLVGDPEFNQEEGRQNFLFSVRCSKGTYVRSLVNDLGEKLDQPAVMINLRRTESSGFNLSQAVNLSEIEREPELVKKFIQPIDILFKDYDTMNLNDNLWKKVQNGASISLPTNAKSVALRYNNKLKAIYKLSNGYYRPDIMLLGNE